MRAASSLGEPHAPGGDVADALLQRRHVGGLGALKPGVAWPDIGFGHICLQVGYPVEV